MEFNIQRSKLPIIGAIIMAIFVVLLIPSNDQKLWIRGAAVYEGEVNQYIMTQSAMENAAASFVGKPVLLAHEWGDPYACVGTIVDAELRHDADLNLYYIEFTATIDNDEAEEHIKKGLFKRLSIGFQLDEVICSIDNSNMAFCEHRAGVWYLTTEGLKQALGIIKKFSGFEISFINVPASAPARVFEWSDDQLRLSINTEMINK